MPLSVLNGHWRDAHSNSMRGDGASGAEGILQACEARQVPYLFKLKHTLNGKRLVQACLSSAGAWTDTQRVGKPWMPACSSTVGAARPYRHQ